MAAANSLRKCSGRKMGSAPAARSAWAHCPVTLRSRSKPSLKSSNMDRWYEIANVAAVDSPALLVYPDRIEENIRRMVAIVGGRRERLRPHIKTHKMPDIVRLQLAQGINKCKCATIAEAEMAAQ